VVGDVLEGLVWIPPRRIGLVVVLSIDPAMDQADGPFVPVLKADLEGPAIAAGEVVQPPYLRIFSHKVDLDVHISVYRGSPCD
jgi:hypothetical protein